MVRSHPRKRSIRASSDEHILTPIRRPVSGLKRSRADRTLARLVISHRPLALPRSGPDAAAGVLADRGAPHISQGLGKRSTPGAAGFLILSQALLGWGGPGASRRCPQGRACTHARGWPRRCLQDARCIGCLPVSWRGRADIDVRRQYKDSLHGRHCNFSREGVPLAETTFCFSVAWTKPAPPAKPLMYTAAIPGLLFLDRVLKPRADLRLL